MTRSSLFHLTNHRIASVLEWLGDDNGTTPARREDADMRTEQEDRAAYRGRGAGRVPIPATIAPGKLSVSALMRRGGVGELGLDVIPHHVVEDLAPGKMSLSWFLRAPERPIPSSLADAALAPDIDHELVAGAVVTEPRDGAADEPPPAAKPLETGIRSRMERLLEADFGDMMVYVESPEVPDSTKAMARGGEVHSGRDARVRTRL